MKKEMKIDFSLGNETKDFKPPKVITKLPGPIRLKDLPELYRKYPKGKVYFVDGEMCICE